MPTVRRHLAAVARAVVPVVLAAAQLVAATGLPLRSAVRAGDQPFPCMHRPCGCGSYDECWAGDCCCFTLREKVAWAYANGFTPPAHAARRVAAEPPPASCSEDAADCAVSSECPHCVKPARGPNPWLIGVFAQKCKGHGPGGWAAMAPAVPVSSSVSPVVRRPTGDTARPVDQFAVAVPSRPADPPPRII